MFPALTFGYVKYGTVKLKREHIDDGISATGGR
jgi:hypothetical protein